MKEDILDLANKAGQGHLVEHYNSIKDSNKAEKFLKQLKDVDFQQTNQLFNDVYLHHKNNGGKKQEVDYKPLQNVASRDEIKKYEEQFDNLGFEAISKGEAGVCIMSGGQGTRLGFDHPKGMFNIKLQLDVTLFEFFARRLLRLMEIAKKRYPDTKWNEKNMIKWYIMTSQMNHQEILTYFKSNCYFGYDKESIFFFPQGGIPAVSYQGKIMIESEQSLSLAPGGNGAIYLEMKNRGALEHMKKNGVKYIYIGPVDNILLKLGDPTCLGFMIKNEYQIASLYVKKAYPKQKVGMHVSLNGKVHIQEYSQMPQQLTELKKQGGEDLVYCHGNRATLYISTDFIERITHTPQIIKKINKKYHVAEKKIKVYDPKTGKSQKPQKENGVKFQLFYFDVFEQTEKFGLFQTLREEEFAPVKNAQGLDSPQSARKLFRDLSKSWVSAAGVPIQGDEYIEVDPSISYNGEGIKQIVDKKYGGSIKSPCVIK